MTRRDKTQNPTTASDAEERFSSFLEQAERSPLTIASYRMDLHGFAVWFEQTNGDAMLPDRITPTDLREYKRWMVNVAEMRPATVNRKLATLKSFLRWAAEAGLADGVTAAKVPKAEKQVRPGPRWLDRREQNALLRAVERASAPRDDALVKLLLNTGLRVQEVCDLTWQDVTISERKGTLTVRQGKGGKRREVPLNADARGALMAMGYGGKPRGDAAIFIGQRGPLTPRGVQSMLTRYVPPQIAREGLDGLSPHMLRHTFCKNLVDAGVSLEKVAALAGHENLETTRRYVEPSLKDLEAAVELIGEGEYTQEPTAPTARRRRRGA